MRYRKIVIVVVVVVVVVVIVIMVLAAGKELWYHKTSESPTNPMPEPRDPKVPYPIIFPWYHIIIPPLCRRKMFSC